MRILIIVTQIQVSTKLFSSQYSTWKISSFLKCLQQSSWISQFKLYRLFISNTLLNNMQQTTFYSLGYFSNLLSHYIWLYIDLTWICCKNFKTTQILCLGCYENTIQQTCLEKISPALPFFPITPTLKPRC